MRAILISAMLLAPLLARANENDETYNTERKAEKKDTGTATKKTDTVTQKAPELTQTQVLDKLHKVNATQSELGNLAQTHARSDKVKDLGQKLTKDFGKLDQQVIGYAKEHDIVLGEATPTAKPEGKALDETKASKLERLGKLQGDEFDRAFLTSAIEGCTRFIPVLEASKGKYGDKKFDRVLDKTLDELKAVQADAEKLQGQIEKPAS